MTETLWKKRIPQDEVPQISGIRNPEEVAEILRKKGIPLDKAEQIPDKVLRAMAKNNETNKILLPVGEQNISILDRLRLDLWQNVSHLGNEARVVAFMDKWGLSTGSRREDFGRAKELMIASKENALKLEKIDSEINREHAIQKVDETVAGAADNFLRRAVAPKEVRESMAMMVSIAVIEQLGIRLFGKAYDPTNGEQIETMREYLGMMFKTEEDKKMVTDNVKHRQELNRLNEANVREELRKVKGENNAELLGNVLVSPINYIKNLANEGILGGNGTLVKAAEATTGVASRLVGGIYEVAETTMDFVGTPKVWIPSATMFGLSFITAMPEWLPLTAAGVTMVGMVSSLEKKWKDRQRVEE